MPNEKNASDIVNAIDNLDSALSKARNFNIDQVDFSDRVLDNRIITLEGYLRFMEREGIPRLKKITNKIEGDSDDRSDIL
jgi:molecular chaperone GrpE (heat shock protein)